MICINRLLDESFEIEGSFVMLETLRHLTQRLNGAADLEQAMSLVVRGVKERLAVDACSIYLVDASGVNFVLVATDGFDPRAVGSVRFALGEGLVGLVIERQCPVNLSDAYAHPRFRHVPEFGEQSHPAFLGVPITHLRRPLGALVVRQLNDRVFRSDEEAFMMAIAAELAGVASSRTAGRTTLGAETDVCGAPAWARGIKGAPGIGMGIGVPPSALADLDAVSDRSVADADTEAVAFEQAVADVRAELRNHAKRMATGLPSETHAIFGVYIEMLDDDALFADTLERIRAGSSAASALRRTIAEHVKAFEGMADPYLRTRAEDIRGLGRRVLLRLQSGTSQPDDYPPRCVLVGEEISIARIADVPAGQLAGIVSAHGSPYSHAAILARTLGIPAVMGLGAVSLDQLSGRTLLVDGNDGCVYIDPGPQAVRRFEQAAQIQAASAVELCSLRDLPAETIDGTTVVLHANAGLSSDLASALQNGAEGIGLFRTEFCFMLCDSFPSEEDQYRVYREVLESFAPKPVTMRTLDIGGDKGLPYFPLKEDNAFLGWRGIRLALDNPGIFLIQLRALLRANAGLGNLKILLPMISSCQEVDVVRRLLARAAAECASAGCLTAPVPLGVMIEVPSAIYQMSALAQRVDFFSIGTNDLTQYLLAVDRSNARVAHHFDSLHPAVLRAVDNAVRSARDARRPISVCGEMAGNPAAAILLTGLGIDVLSMAAISIPPVKRALRAISLRQAQDIAVRALAADEPSSVHHLLELALEEVGLPGSPMPATRAS